LFVVCVCFPNKTNENEKNERCKQEVGKASNISQNQKYQMSGDDGKHEQNDPKTF